MATLFASTSLHHGAGSPLQLGVEESEKPTKSSVHFSSSFSPPELHHAPPIYSSQVVSRALAFAMVGTGVY